MKPGRRQPEQPEQYPSPECPDARGLFMGILRGFGGRQSGIRSRSPTVYGGRLFLSGCRLRLSGNLYVNQIMSSIKSSPLSLARTSVSIFLQATSNQCWSISMPKNFLPRRIAANPVLPAPMKGSRTNSPGWVCSPMKCAASSGGFSVGCWSAPGMIL